MPARVVRGNARRSGGRDGDDLQRRLKARLMAQLHQPENEVCADCTTRGPRWASVTLGVWMCIRCSGIHRHLGVHISFVRSVNLDSWTEAQVEFMEAWGNGRANAKFCANGAPSKPLESDDARVVTRYIKSKYDNRRWATDQDPEPKAARASSSQASAAPAQAAPTQTRRVRRVGSSQANTAAQGAPLTRVVAPGDGAAAPAAAAPASSRAAEVDLLGFDAFESAPVAPAAPAAPAVPQHPPVSMAAGGTQAGTSSDAFGDFHGAQVGGTVAAAPFNGATPAAAGAPAGTTATAGASTGGGAYDAATLAGPTPAAKSRMTASEIMSLYGGGGGGGGGGMMGIQMGGPTPQQMQQMQQMQMLQQQQAQLQQMQQMQQMQGQSQQQPQGQYPQGQGQFAAGAFPGAQHENGYGLAAQMGAMSMGTPHGGQGHGQGQAQYQQQYQQRASQQQYPAPQQFQQQQFQQPQQLHYAQQGHQQQQQQPQYQANLHAQYAQQHQQRPSQQHAQQLYYHGQQAALGAMGNGRGMPNDF